MNLKDTREAAVQLGISVKTLRKRIRNREITAVRQGRQWFVDQEQIDLYCHRRTLKAIPPVRPLVA